MATSLPVCLIQENPPSLELCETKQKSWKGTRNQSLKMEGYHAIYESAADTTKQQERHYYLLSELQNLVKALPSSFQQRLSYTMLSDLALALIDGTVFEIARGLLDIQHLTEKNLYNQRQKLHTEHRMLKQEMVRKHKEALQSCKTHNLAVLRAAQQRELENLEQRVKDEQRMMDEKIVLELDQKVVDQQNTLEKAGVPGFYITTNSQGIFTVLFLCFTSGVNTANEFV
ncbi:protein DGCR6 isoform X2 [Erpetoichthys calabaricus]|uniref:protein DGCR6 isoform X2 n=1 Tax=Erpetoichthys calabaricus TaxID=27687 RepID=UPI002234153F|nr:protein DGCR6 isoform X2 [Erpetoichthys calabaricus]